MLFARKLDDKVDAEISNMLPKKAGRRLDPEEVTTGEIKLELEKPSSTFRVACFIAP
jgi:hypothetical protein